MSIWDTYRSRLNAQGGDRRGAILQRERRLLNAKMLASLSYHQAVINGQSQNLAIINSDNLDTKTLCALPGEDFPHGGIVEWMDNHWLITERDANNEVYTRGVMRQCNYQLRWIADDGKIIERWCIVEDGTKYLTGEYGDNEFVLTRGDTRISVTLPMDKYTISLNRGNRFLIDSYDSPNVLAYELTKPFKVGGTYRDSGVIAFVMQECNTEDSDNFSLHIANYYDHFPRDNDGVTQAPTSPSTPTGKRPGKKVWF